LVTQQVSLAQRRFRRARPAAATARAAAAVQSWPTVPNPPTESEKRFDEYLQTHGYVSEQDLDWRERFGAHTPKNPDRLVSRALEELAICEVKEWRSSPLDRIPAGQRSASFSGEQIFGTLADAVQAAALEQLRPFKDVGLPLVAVLANPHHKHVPLSPDDVTRSLFGTTDSIVVPIGGGPGAARRVSSGVGALAVVDAAGRLANPHPYLSAVVIVHARSNARDFVDREFAARRPEGRLSEDARRDRAIESLRAINTAEREGRLPAGEYEWVEVFDLSGLGDAFDGTPLPSNIFDGSRDRWYVIGDRGFVPRPVQPRAT
jgi:hypothetical protein